MLDPNAILLLAAWIPIAGIALALCIGPDADDLTDEGGWRNSPKTS